MFRHAFAIHDSREGYEDDAHLQPMGWIPGPVTIRSYNSSLLQSLQRVRILELIASGNQTDRQRHIFMGAVEQEKGIWDFLPHLNKIGLVTTKHENEISDEERDYIDEGGEPWPRLTIEDLRWRGAEIVRFFVSRNLLILVLKSLELRSGSGVRNGVTVT